MHNANFFSLDLAIELDKASSY